MGDALIFGASPRKTLLHIAFRELVTKVTLFPYIRTFPARRMSLNRNVRHISHLRHRPLWITWVLP